MILKGDRYLMMKENNFKIIVIEINVIIVNLILKYHRFFKNKHFIIIYFCFKKSNRKKLKLKRKKNNKMEKIQKLYHY